MSIAVIQPAVVPLEGELYDALLARLRAAVGPDRAADVDADDQVELALAFLRGEAITGAST